jgi:hypothetical protein
MNKELTHHTMAGTLERSLVELINRIQRLERPNTTYKLHLIIVDARLHYRFMAYSEGRAIIDARSDSLDTAIRMANVLCKFLEQTIP